MRTLLLLTFVFTILSISAAQDVTTTESAAVLERFREPAIKRWDDEIKKLEQKDRDEGDPADAILFLGSSSIRRWDDISVDMAPYRPIQRGYGGAKYSDLAVFAERLIHPHHYRALVIFVGNDVSGKDTDNPPAVVEQLVRHVIKTSKAHQPEASILLIEVTPTEKRFAVWPQIREVNASLREIALSTPKTYFIATAEHYLDPMGNPRSEFFVEDKLHLNEAGYDRWGGLIRGALSRVLREEAEFAAQDSSE